MSMRGEAHRLDSKEAARVLVFERRLLMAATVAVAVGVLVWIIAISTEYWVTVDCPTVAAVNNTFHRAIGPGYMVSSHRGLWRACRTVHEHPQPVFPASQTPGNVSAAEWWAEAGSNETEVWSNETETAPPPTVPSVEDLGHTVTSCRSLGLQLLQQYSDDHPYNVVIAYRRTTLGFSCISFLLLCLSIFFSAYTFRVNRYTFKRVAACLHFIVAGVQLVVIEVQVTSLHYQELHVRSVFPSGCHWHYSASFVLGWICFIINLLAGVAFLYTSHKKKKVIEGQAEPGTSLENEFDDDPQIMGR